MDNITTITVIPKKEILAINAATGSIIKRRVAAYARVSTDLEDQKNSFNAQLEEYTNRIGKNPTWEFVKLYSDKGISGTSTKHRVGFQRMIKDALDGKIDLILVKSISRFARNTVDCLKTVRELRKKNVEVYFDKEAISTNDTKVDMMLTIFASFAQEESKSISENVKWGVRKRMAKGQRKMNVKTTLGYKTNHEGKVIIDESTKDIVIQVFNLFAAGYTYREIAQIMTDRGIKTGTGKDIWKVYDIDKIISNEKYVGDFVMQKTCVVDFLDHKVVKNNGVEEKYIFQNHHDAIIDRETFNEIQTLRKAKFTKGNNSSSKVNLISKIFYCERCLRNMKVITIHPGTKYARRVFTCKVNNKTSPHYKDCDAPLTIDYELMNRAISEVFNKFNNLPGEIDSTISNAYHSSIQTIIEKIGEYKTLITEAEEKMSALIKLQMEEDDVLKYQDEFNIQKSNVSHYKDEISMLEQVLSEEGKQYLVKEKINQYIAEGTISSEILSEVLKAVIRRKDNSIRFVINDKPVQVDSTTIDDLLDLKPVYSSCVTDKTNTLLFDVVKLGEEVDEH